MPIYLKSIGFSVLLIGVLEGFAEAIAGLSKGYFGKLSDERGKRAPFIQFGYLLSAISKPLMAILIFPLWIFFSRTLDRLGKGIRTSARDAMLSDEATPQTKGKVFGFHRSTDTLGAVLGPLLALLYLYFFPGNYKTLFFIAFAPGMLAFSASLFLKDKKREIKTANKRVSFFSFIKYWKDSNPEYRRLVKGLLLFTLFNSSDVFLLLKMKETGVNDTTIIGVYIFYNLIYALFAFPAGILADKIGLKKVFLFGMMAFAIVYFGMGLNNNPILYAVLFFIYGIYAASTEGITKAWISNISDPKDTATAIGTFTAFQSICSLAASSIAGFLWFAFNPSVTFILSGSITLIVIIYISRIKSAKIK